MASTAQFEIALVELDAWAKRTGQILPTLTSERLFVETELRTWLDGNEAPLDWKYPLGSSEYPRVTADEWFFITTLYGTMAVSAQRTHIRKFYPLLFVEASKSDIRNFHPGMAAYTGLRQNWMKHRLIKMGQILSARGNTMTEYVEFLRDLENAAMPSVPMPARDRIFADHQTSSGKTLSVFVRDCVLGNCFPIDSRVRTQLQAFGLPSHEKDEEWLVKQCLEVGRNPREVARLFYDANGKVRVSRGDQPPELTDENERILDDIWLRIAAEERTAQLGGSSKSAEDIGDSPRLPNDDLLVFADGDAEYLGWLEEHPDGFVVNAYRKKTPNYMVLHKATCRLVSKYAQNTKPGAFTEREFIKICAVRVSDLSTWANSNGRKDGSFTGRCSCRPY